MSDAERVTRWVKYDRGCWEWTGPVDYHGYGSVRYFNEDGQQKSMGAHRLAYRTFEGPLIPGMDLDHLCRNTKCVNPLHLDQVTRSVNLRRGVGRSKR